MTIGGVQAESYTQTGGMLSSQYVFFTKNDIFYYIRLDAESTSGKAKLDELVKSFQFN